MFLRTVPSWRKAAEVGKRRIALLRTHETCEANVQNFVLGPGTGPSPSSQLRTKKIFDHGQKRPD